MIARSHTSALRQLYEDDETAWLEAMARLVAERRFNEIDAEHLSEFLSEMSRRDKREVLSRLTSLLAHLLKWEHQPEQQSNSWRATIASQRDELHDLLENGTLRNYADEILTKAYGRSVRQASLETGLPEETFPAECPRTLDEIVDGE